MQTDGLLHSGPSSRLSANVAQLVERLICNQLVVGSTPSVGSWMVRFDSVLTFGGGDVTTCLPTMCLLLFFLAGGAWLVKTTTLADRQLEAKRQLLGLVDWI